MRTCNGLETIFFNPAQYVVVYRHLGAAETKGSFAFRHSFHVERHERQFRSGVRCKFLFKVSLGSTFR